jgi:hypothetical protein
VPVLGAVVDEQQEPRRRETLDQAVERGLRLRVDPVEILDDHQERLGLALPQEELLQRVDGVLPPRWRGEGLPSGIFHRRVEEREDRRQCRREGVVECEELLRDLVPDGAGLILVTDLKVRAEKAHHRKIGRGRSVRDGGPLQDQPAVRPLGVRDLPDEPGLPDPRLPDKRHDLAVAYLRPGQRAVHLFQFGVAPDEGRHPAARRQARLLEALEPVGRSRR